MLTRKFPLCGIDGMLLEIKVSKELKLHPERLNQLIGYYILSLIGGVNDNARIRPIKQIGVYFARQGVLWTMPISSLANEKTIQEFTAWFVKYVNRQIW